MDDDDYRARPEDHLVEPFLAGLEHDGAGRELREDVRRGCGGAAAALALLVAGGLALLGLT